MPMQNILTGSHNNENHLEKYVTWCRQWVNREPSANWVDEESLIVFEDERSELNQQLDDLLNEYIGTGNLPSGAEASSTFYRLRDFASDRFKDHFMWGDWLDENQVLEHSPGGPAIGYGGELLHSSTLLFMSSLIRHVYSDRPDSIELELTEVKQDSRSVYVGSATASQLDAICSVPNLDPMLSSEEFGAKLYSRNMPDNQWQRVVNVSRIRDISKFIDKADSFIFNPVVLYLDTTTNSEYAELTVIDLDNGKHKAQINFDFLAEKNTGFVDYDPIPDARDLRPLKIVDGQHRVRGMAMSSRGHSLTMPFVLITGDGSKADRLMVAKIFTEINTNSVQLDALHQLYLRYKFSMPDQREGKSGAIISGPNDFSTEEDSVTPTAYGRPQRRAYELAMIMASAPNSPLYDMIEFQRPAIKGRRRADKICISAVNWVQSARKWFLSGSVYSELNSEEWLDDEVFNFFKAFQRTCTTKWPKGRERWSPGRGRGKPLLQFEGPFLSLLDLLPRLVTYIRESEHVEGAITVETFCEWMKPLENVDWMSPRIKNSRLKGRTNDNIRHLVMWMETAILNRASHSKEDILDSNMRSMPGKGIIARPEAPSISKTQGGSWPSDDMPVTYEVEYPEHTLGSAWTVQWELPTGPEYWSSSEMKEVKAVSDSTRGNSKFTELALTPDVVPSNATKIEVICELKNGNGETLSVRQELSLPRLKT